MAQQARTAEAKGTLQAVNTGEVVDTLVAAEAEGTAEGVAMAADRQWLKSIPVMSSSG